MRRLLERNRPSRGTDPGVVDAPMSAQPAHHPLDVYPIEVRYALDMMGFLVSSKGPSSVRICSGDPATVRAIVRRLALDGRELHVESEALRQAVAEQLGVDVLSAPGRTAEAAVCPDLASHPPERERIVVGAARNALSYRSLRHPGSIRSNALRVVSGMRKDYRVDRIVGLYPPSFIALLGAAQVVERVNLGWHFRMADAAFQRFFTFGPDWRLSYIVVLAGER
jgi:hypothetical protein